MKKIENYSIVYLVFLLLISCNSKTKKNSEEDLFAPSYKEQKNDTEFTEYFDTIGNIYSNFKYNIAVKSPKNWEHDEGVTEHMIFRSINRDSAYTFSVNVIETNYNIENIFWKEYQTNKELVENKLTEIVEKQLNTKITTEYTKISYLSNYKTLKRKYEFTMRDEELEYDMCSIIYQVPKGYYTYTISLTIPKIFYNQNPEYFDKIVKSIYWLTNKNEINRIISKTK